MLTDLFSLVREISLGRGGAERNLRWKLSTVFAAVEAVSWMLPQ